MEKRRAPNDFMIKKMFQVKKIVSYNLNGEEVLPLGIHYPLKLSEKGVFSTYFLGKKDHVLIFFEKLRGWRVGGTGQLLSCPPTSIYTYLLSDYLLFHPLKMTMRKMEIALTKTY